MPDIYNMTNSYFCFFGIPQYLIRSNLDQMYDAFIAGTRLSSTQQQTIASTANNRIYSAFLIVRLRCLNISFCKRVPWFIDHAVSQTKMIYFRKILNFRRKFGKFQSCMHRDFIKFWLNNLAWEFTLYT